MTSKLTEAPLKRDIEEPDEVLDSMEGDSIEFWERKQRELVTSTVDYNLGTLADLVSSGTISLSPGYQRRLRWTLERQSLLIESFLMNVPVPPIFLNEDDYGNYSVIDGKQRLSAITDFLSDRLRLVGLKIFADLNGNTFSTLPANLQSVLRTRPTLRSVIILRQSDDDIKTLVFHRLNTGGVTLNAQEIRNNAFPGPLNDLIQKVSGHAKFHRMLHITRKDKSAIYREMRDAEFVLRFLTFKDTWQDFTGGMERHMDSYMRLNQHMPPPELKAAETEFLEALDKAEAAFGDNTFQRWQPEKEHWRQQVLAALFDAQMFAPEDYRIRELAARQEEILAGTKELFSLDEFRRAVDAATNTPSYFRDRISMTRAMIERALS